MLSCILEHRQGCFFISVHNWSISKGVLFLCSSNRESGAVAAQLLQWEMPRSLPPSGDQGRYCTLLSPSACGDWLEKGKQIGWNAKGAEPNPALLCDWLSASSTDLPSPAHWWRCGERCLIDRRQDGGAQPHSGDGEVRAAAGPWKVLPLLLSVSPSPPPCSWSDSVGTAGGSSEHAQSA